MGGSGSVATPANNVGGGTGWGDKGFFKGGSGTEGPGHANVCCTLSKRREGKGKGRRELNQLTNKFNP